LLGLCVGLLGLAWPGVADEPQPKADATLPWQRRLQGEEVKQAEQLQMRINKLAEADQYTDALAAAKELLALRERVQGADHWEAEDAAQQIRTLQQRAAFNEQQRTDYRRAVAALGEAAALQAKGRFAQAQPLREETLTLFRQLLGEEHPYTAASYNNLAFNLEAQGRYAEAEERYRKALRVFRQLLGEEHPHTARTYSNLATNLTYQGKQAEAEEGLRMALALFRRLLGEEHADTATGYNALAYNLAYQGKYAEAEEAYRKALTLRRQLLGEENLPLAVSFNNLAANLQAQGKIAEAEPGLRKALALRQKLLGEEHTDTAASYNNLAANLQAQGKYVEAEAGLRKALALFRQLRGEEHPATATSYNNLAFNLQTQGKYAEAEEGFRKVLTLRRKLLGEAHPATAQSYHNLAGILQYQGKYAEAEEGFRKALARFRQLMGEEHPITAASYQDLAYNLAAQQHHADAEEQLGHAADSFAHAQPRVAGSGLERATAGSFSPFPFLAALLARHDQPERAWQRFEQGLGRGTWDDLSARLAHSPAEQARLGQLARRLERLDQLLEQHGTLQAPTEEQVRQHKEWLSERRQTQEQLDSLTRDLALKSGLGDTGAYSLEQVQAALRPDTALLGWVDAWGGGKAAEMVNERWAVLLRARGHPAWVRLPGSGPNRAWTDTDSRLPEELASLLHARPLLETAAWRPLAQRLYEQRLAPLAAQLGASADLPAVRHLVVLPSPMMDSIPLEVLSDRYTFSRASSATLFGFLHGKPKPQTSGLLALADPIFDGSDAKAPAAPVPPGGLLLTAVVPGSNAARAGLRAGDVLLRYNDIVLQKLDDLKMEPPSPNAKARITVAVWRAGETLTVEVLPGPLGVSLAKEPAPEALAQRRRINAELLASRGDGEWKPLPGTRVEVEALARRFQQAHQALTALTDSDASEQRLTELATGGSLGKFRYLHLATHGTVNWDFPLQSALILARDRLPDPTKQLDAGLPVYTGRLTAAAVLRDWNLDAELVTLSACETGLGHRAEGEGYLGFAQALLLCGSRSVCLSLWQVDDVATALLMDRFYANLLGQRDRLTKGLGKAEALAEAKAWLRTLPRAEALKLASKMTGGVERGKGRPALPQTPVVPETDKDEPPYAHPYYWAAFVLVGDKD
jgi:tetratricopeptide (TPR) repeat protein